VPERRGGGLRFVPRVRNPEVVCKPGSVPRPGCPGRSEDHSSRRHIAVPLEHSDPRAGVRRRFGRAALDSVPIRACSGRGLPRRRSPGCRAWALTPRFQPCLCLRAGCLSHPAHRRPSAVWFLLRFPSGFPGSPLATSLPCGARTFLPRAVIARRRSPVRLWRAQAYHSPRRGPRALPEERSGVSIEYRTGIC